MLRGSSFLLEKSARFYQPMIENIAYADRRLWDLDVDIYTDENISLLLEFEKTIAKSLCKERGLTDTLVTKIMLGVFGNVPAYDDFFRKGFGVHSFGFKTLRIIKRFYDDNKQEIDSVDIRTFDFISEKETNRHYSKAKIIDMVGFTEGQQKNKK